MCMYVCQSVESRAELQELMNTKNHLVIGGNGMVQDSPLAIFILTMEDRELGKSLFFDCLMWIQKPYFDDSGASSPYEPPYTSRRLISFLLPPWLNVDGCVKNGTVVGTLTKKIVKKHILPKLHDNNAENALLFLSSLQRVAAEFFRRRGFSVGLDSLLPDTEVDMSVNIPDNLTDWEMQCIVQQLKNEKAAEAKKLFVETNPFLQLTSECSGAKGSLMNIIQMKTSLGPQLVNGAMIKKYRTSSFGNRVLSSDPFGSLSNTIFTKGYIKGSFLDGLNPQQMFLHAISSRINLLDTALKTANSGYMSRKIWKCLEDAVVHHNTWKDGPMSVRCDGKILCFQIQADSLRNRTIEPGFPVGIILSQSIGQQIMQLTLNTFHNVGSGNSVVEGIPRLEALVNVWCKKLAEQTMVTVPMSAFEIHKRILKRDCVYVKELLTKYTIEKNELILHVEKISCIRKRVHMWHLLEAVNSSCLYPVFTAECINDSGASSTIRITNKYNYPHVQKLLKCIKKLKVRGDDGVHIFDGDGVLQLTGTTLKKEFKNNNINALKLRSNNMLEVAKTLGIAAAKTVLMEELKKVFNNGVHGLYLDILSNYMTFLGEITACTRLGLGKFYGENNVWKGMSFERTLRTASNAATKEITAAFEGLSERICINKLIKHGSGFCDVIKEPPECGHDDCWKGHCKFKLKKKRSFFDIDNQDEPWMPAPEENPFVGGGGFNANGFGMMGGMVPLNTSVMNMNVQESVAPPVWPAMDYTNKPPSRPNSPDYDPTRPPSPPLSPAYIWKADDDDVEWHPN